jgi:hypothetical protein
MLKISGLSVGGDAMVKCHILEQMITDRHEMYELNAVYYPNSDIDTHSCMQEKERWCQGAFVLFVFLSILFYCGWH